MLHWVVNYLERYEARATPSTIGQGRPPAMKRPGAGPGLCLAQCAPELGDAADLLRILVRLGLDGPGSFIGSAQRHLSNALVGVDHLLQAVPRQIALNRHKVLHRAGADDPVYRIDVLLQAVLNEVEHLLRDLLSTARQNRAGLRHSLEVLRRAAGQFLSLRAGETQHLRELIRDALEALGGRVQACLDRVPGCLGAAVGNVSTSTRRLLTHAGGFIGHGAGRTGGLISGLVLIVGVVASRHIHPLWIGNQKCCPTWPVGQAARYARALKVRAIPYNLRQKHDAPMHASNSLHVRCSWNPTRLAEE